MSPHRRSRRLGSPKDWLRLAESDLRLAQIASRDEMVSPEMACFHAQQAAEKAIKAVLLAKRVEFPLSHDIEQLVRLAEVGGLELPDVVREADALTPYAVEARYPGYWLEITPAEVLEALGIAERVLLWAREYMGGEPAEA